MKHTMSHTAVHVYDRYADSHDQSRHIADTSREFAHALVREQMAAWLFQPTCMEPGSIIVSDPIVLTYIEILTQGGSDA